MKMQNVSVFFTIMINNFILFSTVICTLTVHQTLQNPLHTWI